MICTNTSWQLRKQARPCAAPGTLREGITLNVALRAARDQSENDLIKCEWKFKGRRLQALLEANGVRVLFDLSQLAECETTRGAPCVRAAQTWVSQTLKTDGKDRYDHDFQVALPWPEELVDGVWFSSAPDLEITNVLRWHARVDAEVQNAVLTVYAYKRIPQLMSFQDGSKWFDKTFRADILSKSNEQESKP